MAKCELKRRQIMICQTHICITCYVNLYHVMTFYPKFPFIVKKIVEVEKGSQATISLNYLVSIIVRLLKLCTSFRK